MAQIGTICNRIAVIQKGRIVELVETEKLFDHPIHPYTRALLSAIPMPNPDVEQNKTLRVYDPVRYARWEQGTVWEQVEENHWLLADRETIEDYRKVL